MSTKYNHIILIRNNKWDSPVKGSTRILSEIFSARGYKVTYVEQVKFDRTLRVFRHSHRKEGNVDVISVNTWLPVLLQGKNKHYEWCRKTVRRMAVKRAINRIIAEHNADVFCILNTVPGLGFISELCEEYYFYAVDDYSSLNKNIKMKEVSEEQKYSKRTLAIGESMKSLLIEKYGFPASDIVAVGQGVDIESYEQDAPRRDIAVYIGDTQKIDIELLTDLTAQLSSFGYETEIYGNKSATFREEGRISKFSSFKGPIPPHKVPGLLKTVKIGLMPYKADVGMQFGQNPLKLYQYAAAGLHIYSTPHDEYNYIEFPGDIIRANEPFEIENPSESFERSKAVSKEFVEARSWDAVADRILRSIDA